MKNKLILLILCCLTAHTYGALPRLRTATLSAVAACKPFQKQFSTTAPKQVVISDTILKTPTGRIIRNIGDMHIPTEKNYVEVISDCFKSLRTPNKTSFVIEDFNPMAMDICSDAQKEQSKKLCIVRLNATKPTPYLDVIRTAVRTEKNLNNLLFGLSSLQSVLQLLKNPAFMASVSHLQPEQMPTLQRLMNPKLLELNAQTISGLKKHLEEFVTETTLFLDDQKDDIFRAAHTQSFESIKKFLGSIDQLSAMDFSFMKNAPLLQNAAEFTVQANAVKRAAEPFTQALEKIQPLFFSLETTVDNKSLYIALENDEIMKHITQALRKHKHVITYAGAGHTIAINEELKKIGYTQLHHDGLTHFDATKRPLALDCEVIKKNNNTFLQLTKQS